MGVELSGGNTDGGGADGAGPGRDAWTRLGALWHLLFAGTLALPTAAVTAALERGLLTLDRPR